VHPAVRGRERELRALADAVRRLADLTVTTDAPAEETAAVAADLSVLADRLARYLPETPVPRYVGTDAGPVVLQERMPYDFVQGPYNPLALPVEITTEPPRALGRARFTTPYEGPPGCVHGAVIAGVFDIVMSVANQLADAAGPTLELSVRYRRPTLLLREALFEAWVVETDGRRTTTEGRIVQDDRITVEATGRFAVLDRDAINRLRDA
jgi:acyl-coenzyme A thioesterase PaaI-like protein